MLIGSDSSSLARTKHSRPCLSPNTLNFSENCILDCALYMPVSTVPCILHSCFKGPMNPQHLTKITNFDALYKTYRGHMSCPRFTTDSESLKINHNRRYYLTKWSFYWTFVLVITVDFIILCIVLYFRFTGQCSVLLQLQYPACDYIVIADLFPSRS